MGVEFGFYRNPFDSVFKTSLRLKTVCVTDLTDLSVKPQKLTLNRHLRESSIYLFPMEVHNL